MIETESITEEERETCGKRDIENSRDGRVRCLRCREIIGLNQDCPKCGKSWESRLKTQVWILREERKKEEEKKLIAEGNANWTHLDSPDIDEIEL